MGLIKILLGSVGDHVGDCWCFWNQSICPRIPKLMVSQGIATCFLEPLANCSPFVPHGLARSLQNRLLVPALIWISDLPELMIVLQLFFRFLALFCQYCKKFFLLEKISGKIPFWFLVDCKWLDNGSDSHRVNSVINAGADRSGYSLLFTNNSSNKHKSQVTLGLQEQS